MTTTNNQFKNDLVENLMAVSGETTTATYTASNFSDTIADVIKIVFNDTWRGNFRTAYDPLNRETNHIGFREEIFSNNYNIEKNFRVKQIDAKTGKISAEGVALRWVPGSVETGGGTLFIKVLFHDSQNPSSFNSANGVIFCNEVLPFTYGNKTFSGKPMWAGSSIRSVETAINVYKLTTDGPLNVITETIPNTSNGTQIGKGNFEYGQRVYLKTAAEINTTNKTATGIVLASAIDTNTNVLSIFVQFDSEISTCSNCSTYLCLGSSSGDCTQSCCIYGISDTRKISTPECGNIQKIVFADEVGTNFIPGREIFQWKWDEAGNHEGNGTLNNIPNGPDSQYKITGEYINWDSASKTLIVLAPSKLFEVKYGNVCQLDESNNLIVRGSAVSSNLSKFIRKSGSFINLANTTTQSTYVAGKEYYQGWPTTTTGTTTGEYLVQTTENGSTSYDPNYQYAIGETVIQALTQTNDTITNYAAGKVIAWEPNTTALSTVPSKLVIKRYEYGTSDPKFFDTNNSLITKTKQLSRFRINNISPTDDNTILGNSQRNILPLRVFKNAVSGGGLVDWYNFSSDSVKQASITATVTDPANAGNIGTMVKGSSIGTSRVKAIEYYSGSEYKIHLMNSTMTFDAGVSFADTTQIGVLGTETSGSITYNKIYPIINITQELVNNEPTTILYEPLVDKMIVPLPGGEVMENVTGGVANFGSTELTIQKLYNVTFDSNTKIVNVGTSVPSAEFANIFSSSYSFGADNNGNPIKLIKYTGLQGTAEGDVTPSDYSSVYYDVLQDSEESPRNKVILRRKAPSGSTGISKMVFGAEVKCVASSVVKPKQQLQFTETAKLRYQTSGEFAGKWVAELSKYDVSQVLSVFFQGSGDTLLSSNKKEIFGISSQTNDYTYNKSLLVLNSDGIKPNSNTDITQGPIVPFVPVFGTYTQDNINASEYYVEISVTGICYAMSSSTGGIIVRESYKDFNEAQLSVKDIPYYKSKVDDQEYHATGIIDTRAIINSSNSADGTKFVVLPQSSTINTTLGIYQPRKDILYINKEGSFKIAYGQAGMVPEYPSLPEDGMVLYRIDKPAYLFSGKDLTLNYTDNRRYTMRDIGRIEKRVEQLETYSTLSLLEKDADSLLVEDANGNNRFKNGIVVDSFENHKVGDVSHPDYAISIDDVESCARPKFTNEPISLEPIDVNTSFIKVMNAKTGVTGGIENGSFSTGIYMMPYTETPFVVQPQATRSMTVTPFEVVESEGVMRLAPREDDWVDTTTIPELNVNLAGNDDAWEGIANELNASQTGPFGLHYGNWTEFSRRQVGTRNFKGRRKRWWLKGKKRWRGTTFEIEESRTVSGEEIHATTNEVSLGERVVNVNVIPYMREKNIRIAVTGMKPNARIYPFFDGIDVSQYCYGFATLAELSTGTPVMSDANQFSKTIQKTNAQGNAFIFFTLPAGTFRTGDRKFTISDNQSNDFTRASTFAGATYSAYGLSQVKQNAVATVRDFEVETINRVEERTRRQEIVSRVKKRDPLAQTFEINRELYPNGIFLSSIDLFFARKPGNDTNIPVKVELRPTVNGFPDANKIYPGGVCILHPSQVNISDLPAANNAQSITKFTFEHPVYLEPGEHSFVVKSTSEEYEVYLAEIGQTLLNSTQKVTEQPYVGVFFTSSNASTWLPQPGMDMMMTMHKCEFAANTPYTFTIKTGSLGKTIQYELLNFGVTYQEFENAKVSWTMGKDINSVITPIVANTNTQYTLPQILLESENLYFTGTAYTTNKDISPVVNIERMTLFAIKNLIENNSDVQNNGELDSYATELGKQNRARYITKIVTLEEGFESSGFKLVLSVNKPIGTRIQAFIKYQTIEQTKNFHDNYYVQLVPKMGSANFDSYYTRYDDEFVDIEFDLPIDTPVEFNKFAIKLCLYSDNSAYVPRIKDLRGIAVL